MMASLAQAARPSMTEAQRLAAMAMAARSAYIPKWHELTSLQNEYDTTHNKAIHALSGENRMLWEHNTVLQRHLHEAAARIEQLDTTITTLNVEKEEALAVRKGDSVEKDRLAESNRSQRFQIGILDVRVAELEQDCLDAAVVKGVSAATHEKLKQDLEEATLERNAVLKEKKGAVADKEYFIAQIKELRVELKETNDQARSTTVLNALLNQQKKESDEQLADLTEEVGQHKGKLVSEQSAHRQALSTAQQKTIDYVEVKAKLEGRIAGLLEELGEQTTKLDSERIAHQQALSNVQQEAEGHAEANMSLEEITTALQQELSQQQSKLEIEQSAYQQSISKAEQDSADHAKAISTLENINLGCQADMSTLQDHLEFFVAQHHILRDHYSRAKQSIRLPLKLQEELDTTRSELATEKRSRATLSDQCAQIRTERDSLRGELNASSIEHNKLVHQNSARADRLKEQLYTADNEIDHLRCDINDLSRRLRGSDDRIADLRDKIASQNTRLEEAKSWQDRALRLEDDLKHTKNEQLSALRAKDVSAGRCSNCRSSTALDVSFAKIACDRVDQNASLVSPISTTTNSRRDSLRSTAEVGKPAQDCVANTIQGADTIEWHSAPDSPSTYIKTTQITTVSPVDREPLASNTAGKVTHPLPERPATQASSSTRHNSTATSAACNSLPSRPSTSPASTTRQNSNASNNMTLPSVRVSSPERTNVRRQLSITKKPKTSKRPASGNNNDLPTPKRFQRASRPAWARLTPISSAPR
jgi:hypothetical protein